MGKTVGVFRENEVKHLSRGDREKLKRQAIKQLQTSKEIRSLMKSNPKPFATIPEANKILRKKLTPVLKRMPKS
jgi:hypothetical protein